MNEALIKTRIEEISNGKWDQDAKDYYFEILNDLNKIRKIRQFNLNINIGDQPDHTLSNITMIIFEPCDPNGLINQNKQLLSALPMGEILSYKLFEDNIFIINFDY